jgi:peptide deformylase
MKYGQAVLRTKTSPVDPADPMLPALIEDMFETMYAADGVGLAANQVGVSLRLAVIDTSAGEDPEARLVLLNPQIISKAGEVYEEEGCLSVPGLRASVWRAQTAKIRAQNLKGEIFEMESGGLLGKAFQHETDHLDGKLFVDYLSLTQKAAFAGRLKQLKREATAPAAG